MLELILEVEMDSLVFSTAEIVEGLASEVTLESAVCVSLKWVPSPSPEQTDVTQVSVPSSSGTVDMVMLLGLVVGVCCWEKVKGGAAEEGFLGVVTCWCPLK